MPGTVERQTVTRLVEIEAPEGTWTTFDKTPEGWSPARRCATPEEEARAMASRINVLNNGNEDATLIKVRAAAIVHPDHVLHEVKDAIRTRPPEQGEFDRTLRGPRMDAYIEAVLEAMAAKGLAVVDRTRLDPT